jgi:hypothetical protein
LARSHAIAPAPLRFADSSAATMQELHVGVRFTRTDRRRIGKTARKCHFPWNVADESAMNVLTA